MPDANDIPQGYTWALSESQFINHIGRVFTKKVPLPDGSEEKWAAIRIEPHHVNTWGFAHGALIACMAECGNATAGWDPSGPPCVAVDLSIQFIGAPKLGDLLEVRGFLTKRTRTLVFSRCEGMIGGKIVFTATSVQKVVGA